MLFSTKAEYGVRLMVALGRREGERPVSLAALADGENLPLSYLEHLVARLRDAGLVASQRGAHGGYRLAVPASEVRLLEVVEALEGPIALTECGAGSCEREASCVVRAPWQRINRVVRQSLADVRLADLITPPPFPSQSSQEPLNAQ